MNNRLTITPRAYRSCATEIALMNIDTVTAQCDYALTVATGAARLQTYMHADAAEIAARTA